MHRLFSICALLCFLTAAEPSPANGPAEAGLTAQAGSVDLWPSVRVLDDPAGSITADQAFAMQTQFSRPHGAYATLGITQGVTWLRIPLSVKPEGVGSWILDFDYALLGRIDVHLYRDGRLVEHRQLGSALPFATRPLQGRTLATPLEMTAPGHAEILVRIETTGAKILSLSLSRPAEYHAAALREQLLQGALLCLGVLLVFYSLSQWAVQGERLYLKYALLVLCSTLFSVHFFGIGQMYLWRDWDWPQRHMAGITSLLAAAATALFVEDALAGNLRPWLRRALHAVAALHVTAALAHGLDLIDIRVVAFLMATTGITPSLLGLPGAIAMLRRGETVGAWFMLAWIGYFAASAVLVGVVKGQVDANAATLHSFQIGATLDMVIFMRIAVLSTAARLRERERLHQSFGGYVSPAVMEEIMSGRLSPKTQGELRYVCVLFSDIRGYTTRSERHEAGGGARIPESLLRQRRCRSSTGTAARSSPSWGTASWRSSGRHSPWPTPARPPSAQRGTCSSISPGSTGS
jgi:hypothetical protein